MSCSSCSITYIELAYNNERSSTQNSKLKCLSLCRNSLYSFKAIKKNIKTLSADFVFSFNEETEIPQQIKECINRIL